MSAANETGTGIAGTARLRTSIVWVRQMRSCRNPCDTGPDQVRDDQMVRRRIEETGIITQALQLPGTGKSANQCPAPFAKIFRFTSEANHFHSHVIPPRKRGVSRSSRTLSAGCGGRSMSGAQVRGKTRACAARSRTCMRDLLFEV